MTDTLMEFVQPNGVVFPLHAPEVGRHWIEAAEGIDMPDVDFAVAEPYNKDGSMLRNVRFKDREVDVPIALINETVVGLREQQRSLVSGLNPRRGSGILRVSNDNGRSWRYLDCRYAKGADGIMERRANMGPYWVQKVLTFHAFDPLWYDPSPVAGTFALGADQNTTFFPMFADDADVGPHFGASTVYDDLTLVNDGDVTAWPLWHIDGPFAEVTLTNETTGEYVQFTGMTVTAGHWIELDTTQGYVTGVDDVGANVLANMAPDSVPFGLALAENRISLTVTGGGATTNIFYRYTQRYLAA